MLKTLLLLFHLILLDASIKLQPINELLFNIANITFAYLFAEVLKREEPKLEKEENKKPKLPMMVRDEQERP